MPTPRSDGVSMRCRCSLGRMSPTVCVAAVGVAVGVAVEARDALGRLHAPPVLGQVELLLRKRREQQPQAFELLRIEDVLEQPLEVVERDQLALRDVAEVGPRHQEDRRREFGDQVIGQVEVEVEAGQIARRSASSSRR